MKVVERRVRRLLPFLGREMPHENRLPHARLTVMPCPAWIGVRSTSIEESASTSLDGFMELMKGQARRRRPDRGARDGDELQEVAF